MVTATRRAATVQDVPINIAAIGGAEIAEQGFDDLAEIVAFVPGLNVVDQGGRQGNPIIVRGLNANPLSSGDGNNDGGGTVATYLGDIPFFVDLRLNDLERVEFLLGPQGTLYGAGTLGGAIRYIPKRPSFEGDMIEIRADAYTYSEADGVSYDVGATFNKRITDTFAIRGSIDYLDDTGFTDYPYVVREIGVSDPDPDFSDPAALAANFNPVEDADFEETLSGRVGLRWQPNDRIDANLTYYFQFQEVGGRQVTGQNPNVPVQRYQSDLRVLEPNERDNQLVALEVTADLGFAELTSASGYGRFTDDGQRDQTDLLITLNYSYEVFPTFTSFTREQGADDRYNQELRLVSKHGGPIQWIVGGFYNYLEQWAISQEFTPELSQYIIDNPGDFFLCSLDPGNCQILRTDALEYFSTFTSELTETAIFGEISYDITDRITVTVGGRYYDYELDELSDQDFPLLETTYFGRADGSVVFDLQAAGQSENGTLFKFNIDYDVTDDILLYATVSEGYRIGNSNGLAPCPDFDPGSPQGSCALAPGQQFGPDPDDIAQFDERQFGPDETTNYEIGFKTQWADGRITLNGAVYYVDWTDPQVDSATVNASIPITINASGAESQGFDLSTILEVTDNWTVRGSYSYVQTELTEDVPSLIRFTEVSESGGDVFFGTGFEDGQAGDRLPGSPEQQFSIFTRYNYPLGNGDEVDFNFSYAWQSDVLTRTGGRTGNYTLDSFGTARAALTYISDQWTAQLYADNLFDEYIETGARNTPIENQVDLGANTRRFYTNVAPPRSVGVRVTYRFGENL
ncbi:MAG: TonB-dependent receptor [Pseudomonadota bacterium]